jgi:hypothetical protein
LDKIPLVGSVVERSNLSLDKLPLAASVVEPQFSPRSLAAGSKLVRFFRVWIFRRRWHRLVRVVVIKQSIVARIEQEKEAAVRKQAAMVLYRVWKLRNRTVFGVAKTLMREKAWVPTREALELTCDFSQAGAYAVFSSQDHVDWADMVAVGAKVFSGFMDVKSGELMRRVTDLTEEDTLFEGADLVATVFVERKGADLCCSFPFVQEKSRRELDQLIPLSGVAQVNGDDSVPADSKMSCKIDACTPEALVFFSCSAEYDLAESLWDSVAATFLEWAEDVTRKRRGFCF